MANPLEDKQAEFIFGVSKKMRDYIHRIQIQAHASQGRLINDDISIAQMHMLMIVKRFGQITISHLAEMLSVSAPSVSSMVDRLVEKGLLERKRKKEDRRVVTVELTTPATELSDRVEAMVLAGFTSIVEKVGPDVATKWCEVLETVEKVLGEEDI